MKSSVLHLWLWTNLIEKNLSADWSSYCKRENPYGVLWRNVKLEWALWKKVTTIRLMMLDKKRSKLIVGKSGFVVSSTSITTKMWRPRVQLKCFRILDILLFAIVLRFITLALSQPFFHSFLLICQTKSSLRSTVVYLAQLNNALTSRFAFRSNDEK